MIDPMNLVIVAGLSSMVALPIVSCLAVTAVRAAWGKHKDCIAAERAHDALARRLADVEHLSGSDSLMDHEWQAIRDAATRFRDIADHPEMPAHSAAVGSNMVHRLDAILIRHGKSA